MKSSSLLNRRGGMLAAFASVLLLVNAQRLQAQDFHLSQYDMMPMYYNAAQTGMYFGQQDMKFRLTGNYRSQWQKIQGKPYSSIGVGYDMPMERWGVGALVMVVVSLFTKAKPAESLAGLVYGTRSPGMEEPPASGDDAWYRKPALLGWGAVIVAALCYIPFSF